MEPLLERHSLAHLKRDFDWPLLKNPRREIVPAIIGASVLAITGEPVAGIGTAAAGSMLQALVRMNITKLQDVSHPLHRKFGFHVDNFLLMTGYKKNQAKELVTPEFKKIKDVPWAKAEVDTNDLEMAQILSAAIGSYNKQKPYSREDLERKQDEFMTKLLRTSSDVLIVGGPIPIDPLYELMIAKALPCNYELKTGQIFSPAETGCPDKQFPKYEICVKGREEPLVPEWNKLNFGLITCCEKSILFGQGKGLVLNVSGCHWLGTWGTGLLLLDGDKIAKLGDLVKNKTGQTKNFQVVVEIPVNPQTKRPIKEKICIREDLVYKIS